MTTFSPRLPLPARLAPATARPRRPISADERLRRLGAALRRAEVLTLPIGAFAIGFIAALAL